MNCRKWVLSKFSDNKLLLNQLLILLQAWLVFFLNSEGLEFVIIMLVLSVNQIGLDTSDIIFGRLLMYKRKNNGPSTAPCRTPC
jgi:hypothetical protein